jgi:hypothetical protein
MTIGARYRDKIGSEIRQKHGDTLIRTLRKTYGANFAKDCADEDKLSDVLAKLDRGSLYRLIRDYDSGMLPVRLAFPERF